MEKFRDMLTNISRRPELYVGECNLATVSHYITGYCHALEDSGCFDSPLTGWIRWIELRSLICDSTWGWTRILIHIYGSDRAVLNALPLLYEEFLAQRSAIGVEGIETELRRQMLATYGEEGHVPETTDTPEPSWAQALRSMQG